MHKIKKIGIILLCCTIAIGSCALSGCKKEENVEENITIQPLPSQSTQQTIEEAASKNAKDYEHIVNGQTQIEGVKYQNTFLVKNGMFDNNLTYKKLMSIHTDLQKGKDNEVKPNEEVAVCPKGINEENFTIYFLAKEKTTLENTKVKKVAYKITKNTNLYTECIGYHSKEIKQGKSVLDDIIDVFGTPISGAIVGDQINLAYYYSDAQIIVFYNTTTQEGTLSIVF